MMLFGRPTSRSLCGVLRAFFGCSKSALRPVRHFVTVALLACGSAQIWGQQNSSSNEIDPYIRDAVARDIEAQRPVVLYTRTNPPSSPRLEDLPQTNSVPQYGITWTFDKPVRVGR